MPKVVWTGDASSAERAQDSLTAAVKRYKEEATGATKSAAQLNAAALRIKESLDPQQKLNRLYQELGAHVKAGRLSIEQATAAGVKYRQEMLSAANAGNRVAESQVKAFGAEAARNLISYVSGLASIGGAISLVRSELAAIAALDERSIQRTLTVATAEANLRRVVATDPKGAQVLSEAYRISQEQGLPIAGTLEAVTSAYGSSSDADLTIRTIEAAAKKTRDPLKLAETAAGIGFIIQSSKIKDAVEAGGFLDQVLAISPIKDEKVPQALAKVVGSYVSPTAGGSEATAGAVLGLLSQASADDEGDRSRTGAITLETKLDEFFAKNRKKFKLAKDASDGIDEQLDFLFTQGNEGAARQFIESSTFEAPVSGGFSTLFLNPEYRERFRQARGDLGSQAERLRAAGQTSAFVNAGDPQSAARTNESISSIVESLDVAKSGRGIFTQEQREKFITTVAEATGLPNFAARFSVFKNTGASLDRGEAVDFLKTNLAGGEFGAAGDSAAQDALRAMLEKLTSIDRKQGSKITTLPE